MRRNLALVFLLALSVMGWSSCKKKVYTVPTLQVFRQTLSTSSLVDVEFDYKECTGYVISSHEIFKSIDTGSHWRRLLFADTNIVLQKVCVMDSSIVYVLAHNAVYNKNIIYRTQDAGATFQVINGGLYDYRAMEFVSPNIGYMESGGTVNATVNGGASWNSTPGFPAGNMCDLIEFKDLTSGFAMSFATNQLFMTTTGGNTWYTMAYSNANNFRDAKYSKYSDHVIAKASGSSDNGWFVTTDFGLNWTGAKNFYIDGMKDQKHPIMDVADLYNERGYGAGNHNLFYTKDGGYNWEPRYDQNGASLPETFTELYAARADKAFVTTKEGTLITVTFGNQ